MDPGTDPPDDLCGGDVREDRETSFRRLYVAHFDAVLGFALRRVDRPQDAADVAAETFLVAWRRSGQVPRDAGDSGVRLWLYGVARRVIANHRRGEGRRLALGRKLRDQLPAAVQDCAEEVVVRADVAAAIADLGGRDREVLELHLYEGLVSREIAAVLGLTTAVVRPRLSRARARLRAALGDAGERPAATEDRSARNASGRGGHLLSQQPLLTPKEGSR